MPQFEIRHQFMLWLYRASPLLLLICGLAGYGVAGHGSACTARQPWQSISDANLAWQPPDRQGAILAALRRIPAAWYRDMLHPNAVDREAVLLKKIQSHIKHVLLIIVPENEHYTTPSGKYGGDVFNGLCGWPGGNIPLSGIDIALLKTQLRHDLATLVRAGITVDAFEIGDELDWVCFNTDLPFDSNAGNIEDDALLPYARSYAKFLEASVSVIKEPDLYPNATIVTFGTANTMENILARAIAHPAHLINMLTTLDGRNYLDLVNRIGVHLYPDVDHPEAIAPALRKFVAEGHIDKPLWITEWGYHNSFFSADRKKTRVQAFRELHGAVRAAGLPVENMFMFSIASPDWTLIDSGGQLLPEATFFNSFKPCF